MAGEVVERVVGTVGEREVFTFVHHLFKVLHGGVNGFLAILQVFDILRLHVMTENHQHILRSEILPFLHVVPVVGIGFSIEWASEVVNHGATHGARAFEFRIRKVGERVVHVFVVTATVVVHGENRITEALHHHAVEARHQGHQAEAAVEVNVQRVAVEVNVERVEERIVGAFADEESVVLVPHGGFGEEAERVDGEALEFVLLGGSLVELGHGLLRHEGFESLEACVEVLVGGEGFFKDCAHAAVSFGEECGVLLGGSKLVQLDFGEVEHQVELEADFLLRLENRGNGNGTGHRFAAAVNVLDPGFANAAAAESALQHGGCVILVEHRLHGNVQVILLVPGDGHAHATVEVAFGERLFVVEFETADFATVLGLLLKLDALREACGGHEHKARILNALAVLLGHVAGDAVLHLHNRDFAGFLGGIFESEHGRVHREAGEAFVTRSHVAGLGFGNLHALAFVLGFAHRVEGGVLHLGGIVTGLAQEFSVVCPGGGEGALAHGLFAHDTVEEIDDTVEEVDDGAAVEFCTGLVQEGRGAVAPFDVPAFKVGLVVLEKVLLGDGLVELGLGLLLVTQFCGGKERFTLRVHERVLGEHLRKACKVDDFEGGLRIDYGFAEEEVVEAEVSGLFGADLHARHHVHHGSGACRRCGECGADTADSNTRGRRGRRKRGVPGLDKFHGEARGHQLLDGTGLFGAGEVIFNAHSQFHELGLNFYEYKIKNSRG